MKNLRIASIPLVGLAVWAFLACTGVDEPAGVADDAGADGSTTDETGPGPSRDGASQSDATTTLDSGEPDGEAGVGGPPAGAHVIAYAFADQENNTTPYAPPASGSYNVSGGAVTVTRLGVGSYSVNFAGTTVGDLSIAFATAESAAGGVWCQWFGSDIDVTYVRCVNASNIDTDAKFRLTVIAPRTQGATILGYAHADQPSAASYTPLASRSNNAVGGGAITATRSGTGVYAMTFGGLAAGDIENAQVVPFGDATSRCTLGGITGATVSVKCFTAAGVATDAQYDVMIMGKKAGGTARVVAHAFCSNNSVATCPTALRYDDNDGGITDTRSSTGTYAMTFAGQTVDTGAHVLVSAFTQRSRCNLQSLAGSTVGFTCTSASGALQDTNHAVAVVK